MKKENIKIGMRVWFVWSTDDQKYVGKVTDLLDRRATIHSDIGDLFRVPFSHIHPLVKKHKEPLMLLSDTDIVETYRRCSGGISPEHATYLANMLIELKKLSSERRAKIKSKREAVITFMKGKYE